MAGPASPPPSRRFRGFTLLIPSSLEHRSASDPRLAELQATLECAIPMCRHMGLRVVGCHDASLQVAMPLEGNRNHQNTAFAGSLNALCTIAGWGSMYLLLRQLELPGNIVIRRSSIRYHQPVATQEVVARCLPIDQAHIDHFAEMLGDKGQAKLDLAIEVAGNGHAAVSFVGSYVVIRDEKPAV